MIHPNDYGLLVWEIIKNIFKFILYALLLLIVELFVLIGVVTTFYLFMR